MKVIKTLGIEKLVCVLFFMVSSCIYAQELLGPKGYKGDKLHMPPSTNIFPNEGIYKFSNLPDSELKKNLSENIQKIISKQGIIGISMSMLIPEKGLWQLDSGYISKEKNILVDSATVFYWASVSKLITSTVIHQLFLENKLQPTDKLSKWFPGFKNSKKITITHLLNHTSGIFSFNSDSTFHFQNEYHSPKELINSALSKKNNLFDPGEYWSYTNTGYLLLALIAEKIEEKGFPK